MGIPTQVSHAFFVLTRLATLFFGCRDIVSLALNEILGKDGGDHAGIVLRQGLDLVQRTLMVGPDLDQVGLI